MAVPGITPADVVVRAGATALARRGGRLSMLVELRAALRAERDGPRVIRGDEPLGLSASEAELLAEVPFSELEGNRGGQVCRMRIDGA
ncbi:MAG: hypothetical protein IBJ11_03105 [Phycisphaerales bacterium]|nr:hypothetical protein [Phycisphaerales bacterium]